MYAANASNFLLKRVCSEMHAVTKMPKTLQFRQADFAWTNWNRIHQNRKIHAEISPNQPFSLLRAFLDISDYNEQLNCS